VSFFCKNSQQMLQVCIRRSTYLDKDDGGTNGKHSVELDEGIVFGLVIVAVEVYLLDSFNGQILVS